MMLVPIDEGRSKVQISAKVLSVTADFATIRADNGRVGILSAEDYAWNRIPKDLTKVLQIGKELRDGAFVVDANGQQKYSLIHDENENPWLKLAKEYPLNSEFRSVVGNVKEGTGAWVRMNYGIDGFIPQRQLPRGVVPGIDIEARVVEINQAKRQVSLQFVAIPSGPLPKGQAWPFRRGQVCEGYIAKTNPDKGFALVTIEHENRSVTGLLHNSDMSHALRGRLFSQDLQVGDPIRVEIVHFDPYKDPFKPSVKFRERPADTAAPVPETELVEAY